jgi:hypothetical protein
MTSRFPPWPEFQINQPFTAPKAIHANENGQPLQTCLHTKSTFFLKEGACVDILVVVLIAGKLITLE